MEIKELILKKIRQKGQVSSREVVMETGFSRAYINRFFKELCEEGSILRVGKTNRSKYIPAGEKEISAEIDSIKKVHRILKNEKLQEDIIFNDIRKTSAITKNLRKNVLEILSFAFTEMLNNAIEHSRSEKIEVFFEKRPGSVLFIIRDWGVGIFNNIMAKKGLSNQMEAIQDLIKGKQTTAPETHSGQGIFFTSKVCDVLNIQGSDKKIIFNNLIDDVFITSNKTIQGTRILFSINLNSSRDIRKTFNIYTDENYSFNKSEVNIKLYEDDLNYISRSQARRVLAGLDKFKQVVLDFKSVDMVGQAFTDEIFRVWKKVHPEINIEYKNANEDIIFMIERAKKQEIIR